MSDFVWDTFAVAKLRKLWSDTTISASAIGRALRVSKNSVVGKAHRLNLPQRPSPIDRSGTKPRKRSHRAPRSVKVILSFPSDDAASVAPLVKVFPQTTTLAAGMDDRADYPVVNHRMPAPARIDVTNARTDARYTCQWLDGEPRLRNFCGEPCVSGKSWCGFHCDHVFNKTPALSRTGMPT